METCLQSGEVCAHMDTLANHWPLTPSHQDPQPIRSQSSQWEVPDLCHRPMTKEDTHRHTDTEKGRKKRKSKRQRKDSHIYSKVKQISHTHREEQRSESTEEQEVWRDITASHSVERSVLNYSRTFTVFVTNIHAYLRKPSSLTAAAGAAGPASENTSTNRLPALGGAALTEAEERRPRRSAEGEGVDWERERNSVSMSRLSRQSHDYTQQMPN